MIKTGLNDLKNKVKISCAEWSKLSNVPEATIRKILSGETDDPRLETVVRLVVSAGGSMDDLVGLNKEEKIEANAVLTLKEAYESRIADIKEHMNSLKQDKKIFLIAAVALLGVVVALSVALIIAVA